MPILYAKLLKVGGPILTGIGGVIATSSLVSKNAEEKLEDRFKTKALSDEDPTIKEWKDRNESDQEGDGEGSPDGGKQTEGGESTQKQAEGGSESSDAQGPSEGDDSNSDTDKSNEGSVKEEGGNEQGKDGESNGDEAGKNEEVGGGVTENGSTNAEHNHASGTAYGTRDAAMTQREVENARHLTDELKTRLNELLQLTSNS
ncbi:hypothetical protein MHC_03935 [Mycoplasma haemocanis str. Illinois]|uniref:Uncharacterized protein n=1 Tax=Mycoplasma haemocanis (strain Illinois) TaxID=1111676 RepID=H6N7M3_MYCHN|nr:hypothetical protein [Mycoplasma haemocanis]AEW45645.1 hypothetical protein MHC_03935 [Mycoplasma haemocanis str. Illinois]